MRPRAPLVGAPPAEERGRWTQAKQNRLLFAIGRNALPGVFVALLCDGAHVDAYGKLRGRATDRSACR